MTTSISRAQSVVTADSRAVRLLWLLCFFQENKCAKADAAIREWGMSRRTFWRDVARLRAAGVILDPDRKDGGSLRYMGFDSLYPESVREAQNRYVREAREREERLIAESLDKRALVENARREKQLAAKMLSENQKRVTKARREADYWRETQERHAEMMLLDAYYGPVR
jgi:predicted DNA-binding transcriptional regulator YafY